jgi:hypothetical protein
MNLRSRGPCDSRSRSLLGTALHEGDWYDFAGEVDAGPFGFQARVHYLNHGFTEAF